MVNYSMNSYTFKPFVLLIEKELKEYKKGIGLISALKCELRLSLMESVCTV